MSVFSNLFREKPTWVITTFFAVLSAIALIESQLGVAISLNIALANGLLSVAVTFLVVQVGEWRFRRFIKLSKGDSINIVISAYQDKRKYDPAKPQASNLRYFKTKNDKRYDLVGAHGYLTGLETAEVVAKFVYQFRDIISSEIDVVADDVSILKSGPIICFGSPNSNLQSEKLLPDDLCRFQGPDKMLCPKLHDNPYVASDIHDFGVLARVHYQDSSGRRTWAFVCAGIDEEGTVAASYYLLNNWRGLAKHDTAFLHILRCEKKAPQRPEKIAGYSCGREGVWQAE